MDLVGSIPLFISKTAIKTLVPLGQISGRNWSVWFEVIIDALNGTAGNMKFSLGFEFWSDGLRRKPKKLSENWIGTSVEYRRRLGGRVTGAVETEGLRASGERILGRRIDKEHLILVGEDYGRMEWHWSGAGIVI